MFKTVERTHAFYIVLILVAMLVGTISYRSSGSENFSTILSFAVGFTSMILAIIAIIQNLVSSPNMARLPAELSGSSNQISAATQLLNEASGELRHRVRAIEAIPARIQESESRILQQVASVSVANKSETASDVQDSGLELGKDRKPTPNFQFYTNGMMVCMYLAVRLVADGERRNIDSIFDKSPGGKWMSGYSKGVIIGLISSGAVVGHAESDDIEVSELRSFSTEYVLSEMESEPKDFFTIYRTIIDQFFDESLLSETQEEPV